ncbi:MAG: hypothetical protein R3D59_03715 [Paracoccaceae bacterium]
MRVGKEVRALPRERSDADTARSALQPEDGAGAAAISAQTRRFAAKPPENKPVETSRLGNKTGNGHLLSISVGVLLRKSEARTDSIEIALCLPI